MDFIDQILSLRPQVMRPAKGMLRRPYLVPGGFYNEQWDWDGFFIGLHFAKEGQPEPLRNWALNCLDFASQDGYVPGCLTPEGPEKGHRDFPMKPFLAQGVAEVLGNGAWVEPFYQRLVAAVLRRERTHYDSRFGLFFWDDAMQSGADNNPAITNEPSLRQQILAVDINAYMVREYRALAQVARCLGYDGMQYERKAQAVMDSVEVHLWNPEDGIYWNLNRTTGTPLRHVTWSIATLLWAEAVEVTRAREMIERYVLSEDHLMSGFGLRSLSSSDSLYNNQKIIWPHSNWQGPVWVVANYIAYNGLRNYRYLKEAHVLADRVASALQADLEQNRTLHENYSAETGVPLAPSADTSPNGVEGGFVGWNLLILNMLR